MILNNQTLIERDLQVLWHPCTQMKDHETIPLIPIKQGQGVWIEDYEGKRYIDAISSWWVNLFGHNHAAINAALSDQLSKLAHVIFAGFTHHPAITLAEKLIALAPPGLSRCFYADNGSSAVEAALKMSFHYWQNKNQPQKTRFIHLTNSYHGETIGALSVSDVALYSHTYQPLLLNTIKVPSPDNYFKAPGESAKEHSIRMFAHMERALEQYQDSVCAVIVEPLVQCAGSMRMYHPHYLTLLRKACDKYQVHLIADEIAVGFGRTGTFFACEQAQITPDLMCLSKGLTGGYLPLSAVLTTDTLYQAFYEDYTKLTAFLHSHSYTGNALAARAGIATLELFTQQNVIENNHALALQLKEMLRPFYDHPHVGDVRQTGLIAAIEMVQNKKSKSPFPWQERRGLKVYQQALQNGVLLRPLGDVIYIMPPYVISPDELQTVIQVMWDSINNVYY